MSAVAALAVYEAMQTQVSEEFVQQHAGLVKRIAHHLLLRLPASVLVDDLIQAGMIGLLEAARKFDDSKGASFETYAGIRIRGAMLDEMRKGDWVPRSVHRNARKVSDAIKVVEDRTGRDARDTEVAKELGVSVEEYNTMLQDAAGGRLFGIEDIAGAEDTISEGLSGGSASPFEQVAEGDFQEHLADAITTLPERERLVLALYYDEELNLKEIGAVLGVSESRVCQIHSQAAMRLRSRLKEWQ